MEHLINEIADKYIGPLNRKENILSEIINGIIINTKENYFDIGYLINLYKKENQDGEEYIYGKCKEIIFSPLLNDIGNGKKKSYKKHLNKLLKQEKTTKDNQLSYLDETILPLIVAQEFIKNEDINKNNCLCINNIEDTSCIKILSNLNTIEYSTKLDYSLLGINKKLNSIYILPIYLIYSTDIEEHHTSKTLHSILVFDLFEKKEYSQESIEKLSKTISQIASRNINEKADNEFNDLLNNLSEFDSSIENVKTLTEEDHRIFEYISKFYNCNQKGNIIFRKLKNISYWSYNNTINNKKYLVKNKISIFRGNQQSLDSNDISIIHCDGSNHHYYCEIIETMISKIKGKETLSFNNFIDKKTYKQIKNSLINEKEFSLRNNIKDDDIVVFFLIIPEIDKKNSEADIEFLFKELNISFMVFYFEKNTYPYYYNNFFLEVLSHKIFENYRLSIHKIRRKIRTDIFKNISLNLSKDVDFYSHATKVIKKYIGCEGIILYVFNQDDNKILEKKSFHQSLFNDEIANLINVPEEIDINEKNYNKTNIGFIPIEYINDLYSYIEEILEKIKIKNNFESINNDSNNKNLHEFLPFFWNKEHDILQQNDLTLHNKIHSVLILPTYISDSNPNGILICFNNNANIYYKNRKNRENNFNKSTYFSKDEAEIASIGAEVLGTYTELNISTQYTNRVLAKLGHEIPKQSEFISSVMKSIMELLQDVFGIDFKEMDKVEQFLEQHFPKFELKEKRLLKSYFNQINLASTTLTVFSSFTEMKNLNKEIVKKNKIKLNLSIFLKSIMDIYNEEAGNKGIFIDFNVVPWNPSNHIIDAHKLMRLAIINIINNAIKYSYFGTVIKIFFKEESPKYFVTVENFGLPINPDEANKIFREKFRGVEAAKINIEGLGYGLSLADSIVKAHEGELLLEINSTNTIGKRNIFGLNIIKNLYGHFDELRKKNIKFNSKEQLVYENIIQLNFNEYINFTKEENSTLNKYNKYIFPFKQNYINIIDTLYEKFDGGMSIISFINEQIKPISHTIFKMELKKYIN